MVNQHQFEVHILDINDENFEEKLTDYKKKLLKEIKNLECRDITIVTKVKQISERAFKVESTINKKIDDEFGT